MKTAVEWYCKKSVALSEDLRTSRINFIEWFKEQADILKQAKEMEKEQMIEFAKYTSRIDTDKSDMNKVIDFYLTLDGEEFVEETFKSE